VTLPVTLLPGVPALLPEHASLVDPVAELRSACLAAVGRLGPRVRVVAPGDGWGTRVASYLLAALGAETVTDDPGGVLVVGNGSAKRTERAPGHFDPRAEGFDVALRVALLAPDPAALAAIDGALAEELWADVAGLRALGGLLATGHRAKVEYDDAPYGVQYWVVHWAT
jgi:hypothetical protein